MLSSAEIITLCTGMSLAFCIFTSITKLLKSAKTPLTLRISGKLPLYLPDKVKGPSNVRSGIWEGYTYHKTLQIMPWEKRERTTSSGKVGKNATYSSKHVTEINSRDWQDMWIPSWYHIRVFIFQYFSKDHINRKNVSRAQTSPQVPEGLGKLW